MAPLFALKKDIDFISIQYGDVASEIAYAKKRYGVTFHEAPGVDLQNDIEANLALTEACDLTISVASAPGQFALAAGASVIIMCLGQPWWDFGGTSKVLFAQDGEFVYDVKSRDWGKVLNRVVRRIKERLFV